MRSLIVCVCAIALSGCGFESVSDYIDMELSDGLDAQRIDLDPLTEAVGIDNTVVVDLAYRDADNMGGQRLAPVNFVQYRIDFSVDGESAPFLAGELNVVVQPGETLNLIMPVVGPKQLAWAADRMTGQEYDVRAKVQLAGLADTNQGAPEVVIISHEFTATFSDYKQGM